MNDLLRVPVINASLRKNNHQFLKLFTWSGDGSPLSGKKSNIKPKSISGYIGGKVGPVMIIPMYQAEKGDKSYHLLITINPTDILNAITGAGKTKGHGHGN